MTPLRSLVPLAALLFLGNASAQQLVHDDFDRPNSTNLGPDWVESNNDLEIFGNAVRGKFAFMSDTWMHHATFAQPHATSKARIDFAPTAGDAFFGVGVVIGLDHTTWGGTAVRVTDNDLDGKFDRLFFMAAINAGAWYTQSTPIWFDFPPLGIGTLTVWAEPADDMVVARIDDKAGNLVGVYTASGIAASPFPPTGSDVGVWISSQARGDNFWAMEHRALDAYPADVSYVTGGTQTLDVSLGTAHAGELYLLLGSLSGTAPGVDLGGGVLLPLNPDAHTNWMLTNPGAAPYGKAIGFLDSVGHARAKITIPAGLSPSFAGLTFQHAALALDLVTGPTAATNAASITLVP